MQTWAKRGLQTALVTGGLLMLGTGIASADEDVSPDRPASPLDGSLVIPVNIDNNAIGTIGGQRDLPSVTKEIRISPAELTKRLPTGDLPTGNLPTGNLPTGNLPAAGLPVPVNKPLAKPADKVVKHGDPLRGNRVNGDVVIPVDISGNAIALGGNAEVNNDSQQSVEYSKPVSTVGSGDFLAGNVVDLDWALPVQVTGNALSVLGNAKSTSNASQETTNNGDIDADGSHGVLSGNVLAGQASTPVQLTGNAIAGGGNAETDSTAQTSATSGGYILTTGEDGLGSGNIGAVPVATPLEGNGNALSGFGRATSSSQTSADAKAGAERKGMYGVPTYAETNGDPAVGSGNVATAPVSGPATLCGNAGSAVGSADATCGSETEAEAGGTNRSTGEGSVGSGSIASTPVSLPSSGFGNAVAAGGDSDATADNQVTSDAGGDSYTRGHDSLASGTVASAPVSGTGDVFANSVAGAGDSTSEATNDVTTTSGGNTGTTGDDSLVGGNMVTAPVSAPVESFGNSAAGAGGADSSGTETKEVTSGGGSNTDDDNGVLASNLVTTPVATAAQAFGNSGGAVAFTSAEAEADNEVTAGGQSKATGPGGLGSGNIAQSPISAPAQLFGNGVSGLAGGHQRADADTTSTAGGEATTDGTGGVVSGNVVSGTAGSAGQVYGETVAGLGLNDTSADSTTESTAGGDTETSGASGLGSGNVVAGQTLPLAQSFGAATSGLGGGTSSSTTNDTSANSGGDIDTTGDSGVLSGNLADVPAAGVVQPFGDAVSAVGSQAATTSSSETQGSAGGTSTTSGETGQLSGVDGTLPVGLNAPIYDVPVEVLAQAMADSVNSSDVSVGEQQAFDVLGGSSVNQRSLPRTEPLSIVDGALPDTALPMLPTELNSVGANPTAPAGAVLDGFTGGLSGMPGLPDAGTVAGTLPTDMTGSLPTARSAREVPMPLPKPVSIPGVPDVGNFHGVLEPVTGLAGGVPGAGVLGGVGSVDNMLPGVVPGLPGVPGDVHALPVPEPRFAAPAPGLPKLPALPTVPGVPSLPTGGLPEVAALDEVPSVGTLPDVTDVPSVQLPAVSGLDVAPELNEDVVSGGLADTRAKLATLFGEHPIG